MKILLKVCSWKWDWSGMLSGWFRDKLKGVIMKTVKCLVFYYRFLSYFCHFFCHLSFPFSWTDEHIPFWYPTDPPKLKFYPPSNSSYTRTAGTKFVHFRPFSAITTLSHRGNTISTDHKSPPNWSLLQFFSATRQTYPLTLTVSLKNATWEYGTVSLAHTTLKNTHNSLMSWKIATHTISHRLSHSTTISGTCPPISAIVLNISSPYPWTLCSIRLSHHQSPLSCNCVWGINLM